MQLIRRAVAAATIITAIGVGIGTTAMAGPCESRQMHTAFAPWGDPNLYFVANGGTFERGDTPWEMHGRGRVGWGQNPHAVNGWGASSLRLPPRSAAVSPAICVFSNEETLRFFFRGPGNGATLQVHVEVANELGVASTTTEIVSSSRGWDVSPIIPLPSLRDANGEQWITIRFTGLQSRGAWQIDDVMIDPWVAR
jgi:hypothetical protein